MKMIAVAPKERLTLRVARYLLVNDTKTGKMYQMNINVPNGYKIFQMAIRYIHYVFPIYVRPSKIVPNRNFWFENKPSGNPADPRNI
jgi:hypothetical protein